MDITFLGILVKTSIEPTKTNPMSQPLIDAHWLVFFVVYIGFWQCWAEIVKTLRKTASQRGSMSSWDIVFVFLTCS